MKYKASIILLAFIAVNASIILVKVATGRIGQMETWRLVCAGLGFVAITALAVFFVRLNIRRRRSEGVR
jgi:hypothetical protein